MGNRTWLVALLLGLGVFIVYFFTSPGETPYNHFTLLADAFLKGHLYVEGSYPWIEKAPISESQFYIVNPAGPALLMLPFVKIFGLNFPQHIFAHFIGSALAVSVFFLSLSIKKDLRLALWSGLLTGLGSIVWFLSSVGSVWYLGQTTAALFLTLCIIEILKSKRPIVVGILFGFAFLSRIHLILVLPIFAFIIYKQKEGLKNVFKMVLTFLPFLIFEFSYNFLRYGSIFNQGYFLIPGTANEPWFAKGIMHPSYILADLEIAFLKMPIIQNTAPYIIPSWAGMAIWITTPAFVYALAAGFKNTINRLFVLGILLIFIIVGMHGGTGFAQFGYRFAVDFYPFLLYLTIQGVSKSRSLNWMHTALLIIGIIVNLWGVVWINFFNWVGW